uniref:PilW family protein n=1 Tax=Aeromonas veronii TaxID=654 RepID=UPI003F66915E
DLRWSGFWGDFTGGALIAGDELSLSADATVTNDCLVERTEGCLPSHLFPVRPLWVTHISAAGTMSGFACISSSTRVASSDVISIKRLIGNPVTGGLDANRFYMATNTQQAHLFSGNETAPSEAAMPMRQIWEYQHYVYYLSPNGRGGFELRKRILTADGGSWLISGALVDGIERMVLLFGVDTSNVPDGRVDKFSAIDAVTSQEWGEWRVIAVRVF